MKLKWTYEACRKDALKYASRGEWSNKSPSAYQAARRGGWLDNVCKHMQPQRKPPGYWTLARCKTKAKAFVTRAEWQREHRASYNAAYAKGWLDKCLPVSVVQKSWTLEKAKTAAAPFETRTKWARADPAGYRAAGRHGWLDECFPLTG